MKQPPKEIWLQWGEAEITWCDHQVDDTDVKYVISEEPEDEKRTDLSVLKDEQPKTGPRDKHNSRIGRRGSEEIRTEGAVGDK